MSYELQVWSAVAPVLDDILRADDGWVCANGTWYLAKKSYQAVVSEPAPIDAEETPPECTALLPGLAFRVCLDLEGSAPTTAIRHLHSLAVQIASHSHGVVADPQAGTVTTPRGVRRFTKPTTPSFSVLTMTWYMLGGPLTEQRRTTMDALLRCFERHLPEAMPRRYGRGSERVVYNPEQREALLDALASRPGDPTLLDWRPSAPVVGISCFADPSERCLVGGRFRARTFQLTLRADVLTQPGWAVAYRRLWRALTRTLKPFYADVRKNSGYSLHGGQLFLEPRTQPDPTDQGSAAYGPWFAGIPAALGVAAALGPPYATLWPTFGEATDAFRLAEVDDWATPTDVTAITGEVPISIRARGIGPNVVDLPEIWPFGADAIRAFERGSHR